MHSAIFHYYSETDYSYNSQGHSVCSSHPKTNLNCSLVVQKPEIIFGFPVHILHIILAHRDFWRVQKLVISSVSVWVDPNKLLTTVRVPPPTIICI